MMTRSLSALALMTVLSLPSYAEELNSRYLLDKMCVTQEDTYILARSSLQRTVPEYNRNVWKVIKSDLFSNSHPCGPDEL